MRTHARSFVLVAMTTLLAACGSTSDDSSGGGGGGSGGGSGAAGAGGMGGIGGMAGTGGGKVSYVSLKEGDKFLDFNVDPFGGIEMGKEGGVDGATFGARLQLPENPSAQSVMTIILRRPVDTKPATLACGDQALISYGSGWTKTNATACSVTVTKWPASAGESIEGTFSGTVATPADGAQAITDGRFSVPIQTIK